MKAWRLRWCPSCGVTRPAGEFTCSDYGENWRKRGAARRRCQACGYEAATAAFRVVELPADPRPAEPEREPVPWWAK